MPQSSAESPRGKLTAAARLWASGRGGVLNKATDIVTQTAILPAWMERRAPARDEVELSIDEAQSFSLFASLETQWRRHPFIGSRIGIDYAAIAPTAAMLDVTLSPAVLADIRVMEMAALNAFAEAERRR